MLERSRNAGMEPAWPGPEPLTPDMADGLPGDQSVSCLTAAHMFDDLLTEDA
jgi:hypothetical protein